MSSVCGLIESNRKILIDDDPSFCADLGTRINLLKLFNSPIIIARIQKNDIELNEAFLIFLFTHSLKSFLEAKPFSGIFFSVASKSLEYWKLRLIMSQDSS